MRKKKKKMYFFEIRDEKGEVWRENPPISLDKLQELYKAGKLLDTSGLCRWVGWNTRYIYQLMDEYGLPYIKLGRSYYFEKERIKEWDKQRKRR